MRVTGCEILRLRLPFRSAFRHAAAERSASDMILVVLEDDGGHRGFGEILARSYVTGETNEEIFAVGAPELGALVVGQRFERPAALLAFLRAELEGERWQPRSEERRVGKECRARGAPKPRKKTDAGCLGG